SSCNTMSQQNQDYIHIEEDIADDSFTPRVVQLRNVAYSKPLSSTPKPTNRAQVLEGLMPLSRNSWISVPTLLCDSPPENTPKNVFNTPTQ
ncbi:hypothetical protein BGZ58_005036, partial [Dissophora ornata]